MTVCVWVGGGGRVGRVGVSVCEGHRGTQRAFDGTLKDEKKWRGVVEGMRRTR